MRWVPRVGLRQAGLFEAMVVRSWCRVRLEIRTPCRVYDRSQSSHEHFLIPKNSRTHLGHGPRDFQTYLGTYQFDSSPLDMPENVNISDSTEFGIIFACEYHLTISQSM
jgi:hypothetical protein